MTALEFTPEGNATRDHRGVLRMAGVLLEAAHRGETLVVRINGRLFDTRVVEVHSNAHAQGNSVVTVEFLDSDLNGILWTGTKPRRKR
jgi:hypothetical protein